MNKFKVLADIRLWCGMRVKEYVELFKLKQTFLLLFTGVSAYFRASSPFDLWKFVLFVLSLIHI